MLPEHPLRGRATRTVGKEILAHEGDVERDDLLWLLVRVVPVAAEVAAVLEEIFVVLVGVQVG